MRKSEALQLLGGTPASAASAIGITPQAVYAWPEELPATIADRVLAALYRKQQAEAEAPKTPKRRRTDHPKAAA
jgi:hypothetical protein